MRDRIHCFVGFLLCSLLVVSCQPIGGGGDAGNPGNPETTGEQPGKRASVTFEITVKNISPKGILKTSDNKSHGVGFAPGLWVLHAEAWKLFEEGKPTGKEGLEALAEDGNPKVLYDSLKSRSELKVGIFTKLSGTTYKEVPLEPGESIKFKVTASPGERLSMAMMFGQSNDVFVATKVGGVALFDAQNKAIKGALTSSFHYWDAGTEVNEEPGLGANQAPRQKAANSGPDEKGTVSALKDNKDAKGFTFPALDKILQITITPAS